jgi:hypothetical protein
MVSVDSSMSSLTGEKAMRKIAGGGAQRGQKRARHGDPCVRRCPGGSQCGRSDEQQGSARQGTLEEIQREHREQQADKPDLQGLAERPPDPARDGHQEGEHQWRDEYEPDRHEQDVAACVAARHEELRVPSELVE